MERPIAFRNRGQALYGMLHLPETHGAFPAVALLHGFGGNRSDTYRMFPTLARALATRGIAALRFDFRGCGESEGDFSAVTISGQVSDALAALDFLEQQPEIDGRRLALAGLSLGGAVAAMVAGSDRRVRALVLWSAPADERSVFDSYMTRVGARPLAGGDRELGGLVLGRAFIDEIPYVVPARDIQRYDGPILIVHGTRDDVVPPQHAEQYYAAARGGKQLALIEGADHVFSSVAWQTEVRNLSLEWLAHSLEV